MPQSAHARQTLTKDARYYAYGCKDGRSYPLPPEMRNSDLERVHGMQYGALGDVSTRDIWLRKVQARSRVEGDLSTAPKIENTQSA